jgi:hypothetical protein
MDQALVNNVIPPYLEGPYMCASAFVSDVSLIDVLELMLGPSSCEGKQKSMGDLRVTPTFHGMESRKGHKLV